MHREGNTWLIWVQLGNFSIHIIYLHVHVYTWPSLIRWLWSCLHWPGVTIVTLTPTLSVGYQLVDIIQWSKWNWKGGRTPSFPRSTDRASWRLKHELKLNSNARNGNCRKHLKIAQFASAVRTLNLYGYWTGIYTVQVLEHVQCAVHQYKWSSCSLASSSVYLL